MVFNKVVNGVEVKLSQDEIDDILARKMEDDAKKERTYALINIRKLEAQITPRRMREAMLGIDGGWLEAKEAEIQKLREDL